MTLIDRNLLGELVNNDNVHYEDIMSIPTVDVNNLIIDELEKIKQEVEEEKIDIDLNIGQERLYNNAINDVMQIIDNHIAELKGIVDRIEEPVKKALSKLKGENK